MIVNKITRQFTIHNSQLGSACAARLTRFGVPQRFALSPLNPFSHKGFTVVELMLLLLVTSLVMAVTIPVVSLYMPDTDSSGSGTSGIWQTVSSPSGSIYFGTNADTKEAAIGTDTIASSDARLLINTSSAAQNQITFNQGTGTTFNNYGSLALNAEPISNLGLGTPTFPTNNGVTTHHSTAVGKNTSIDGSPYSVAIGSYITLSGEDFTAGGVFQQSNHGNYGTLSQGYNVVLGGGGAAGANCQGYAQGTTSIGLASIGAFGSTVVSGEAIGNCILDLACQTTNWGPPLVPCDYSIVLGACAYGTMTQAKYSLLIVCNGNTQNISAAANGSAILGGSRNTTGTCATANQIKIGNTNNKVYIPGTLYVGKTTGGSGTGAFVVNGSNQWTTSDRRLKDIHGEFTGGLNEIRQLKPYNYTFKKSDDKTPLVGVMAQDLQKVFPNAVSKNDEGYFMIRREDMFYALLNSIKQLDKMLTNIKARIMQAEDKILALMKVDKMTTKKIKELESINKKYEARIARLEKNSKR